MAKLRSKVKPLPKRFSFYIDDTGHILTQNVRFQFSELLKRILREESIWKGRNITLDGISDGSEDMERPALSFSISWISCYHKHLRISIDTVPAIYLKGWWPCHLRKGQPSLMTTEIRGEGCFLLASVQEERGPDSSDAFHFRVSCFPAEKYLLQNLKPEVRNAYVLAKILKRNGICPYIKMKGDGVHTKDHVVDSESTIKSYMLKNGFFHVLADNPTLLYGLQKQTSQDDVYRFTVCLTIKVLQKIQHLVRRDKTLPAYFLPNQNILNYEDTHIDLNDSNEVRERTETLALEIDIFCTVMLGCLGVFDK